MFFALHATEVDAFQDQQEQQKPQYQSCPQMLSVAWELDLGDVVQEGEGCWAEDPQGGQKLG